MSSVTSALDGVRNQLPTVRLSRPQEILGKINRVAVPLVALLGAAYLAKAEAGASEYGACVRDCTGNGGHVFWCSILCAPALGM